MFEQKNLIHLNLQHQCKALNVIEIDFVVVPFWVKGLLLINRHSSHVSLSCAFFSVLHRQTSFMPSSRELFVWRISAALFLSFMTRVRNGAYVDANVISYFPLQTTTTRGTTPAGSWSPPCCGTRPSSCPRRSSRKSKMSTGRKENLLIVVQCVH